MAEVRLEHLKKTIGRQEIIADLTLTVRDGECFALVGPSGSGKSTLLHLIAGLESPTAGRILFDGREVTALEPRERDVALVFQSYALYPHLTVAENLAFPLRVGPARVRDRTAIDDEVRRVAAFLELDALLARRPRELSGGQRQRVALGRALIRQPRVFLLDEPLSNLDAQLRAGMRAELRRLHDQLGITMIYVTHDQTEAMTLADRMAVLDGGRIQQVGTPDEVYEAPANTMVAGFIGHPPMNVWAATMEDGTAVAGPLRVPVSHGGTATGDLVHLGVRPEHVRIAAVDSRAGRGAGSNAWPGMVRLVEPGGGRTWVTVELSGRQRLTIVGLGEESLHPRPGDAVAVTLTGAGAELHLFDAQTGARIPDSATALPPGALAHGGA